MANQTASRASGTKTDSLTNSHTALIETLSANMAKRPKQCLFRAHTLRQEDLAEDTTAENLAPEKLRGEALLLWHALSATPALYEPLLTISIAPDLSTQRVQFHVDVHRKHDSKVICGRYLAHLEMQRSARKLAPVILANSNSKLTLAIIHAGSRSDDESYRKEIKAQASKIGIITSEIQLDEHPTPQQLRELLLDLNQQPDIAGVMVQTIRDKGIDAVVRECLGNNRDPECVNEHHTFEVLLATPRTYIGAPSTALSCQALIYEACPNLEGKHVVIVNNSAVIGKPLAMLLTRHGATVTLCCKESGKLLHKLTKQADIIVCATGVRGLIGKKNVKKGVVLIDVGINPGKAADGRDIVVGDFVMEELVKKASRYTEVPGGVGPLTTAYFLSNLVTQTLAQWSLGRTNTR